MLASPLLCLNFYSLRMGHGQGNLELLAILSKFITLFLWRSGFEAIMNSLLSREWGKCTAFSVLCVWRHSGVGIYPNCRGSPHCPSSEPKDRFMIKIVFTFTPEGNSSSSSSCSSELLSCGTCPLSPPMVPLSSRSLSSSHAFPPCFLRRLLSCLLS